MSITIYKSKWEEALERAESILKTARDLPPAEMDAKIRLANSWITIATVYKEAPDNPGQT